MSAEYIQEELVRRKVADLTADELDSFEPGEGRTYYYSDGKPVSIYKPAAYGFTLVGYTADGKFGHAVSCTLTQVLETVRNENEGR